MTSNQPIHEPIRLQVHENFANMRGFEQSSNQPSDEPDNRQTSNQPDPKVIITLIIGFSDNNDDDDFCNNDYEGS